MSPLRFRDPRSTKYDFLERILVTCPGCGGEAYVVPAPGEEVAEPVRAGYSRPRRFACHGCGLTKTTDSRQIAFSRGTRHAATDPYFDLPLRLQTRTRHGWLWAYDHEHLTLIENYVRATLRERAPWYDNGQKMTLVARLPRWIKQARHRDEVLRALARISAATPAPVTDPEPEPPARHIRFQGGR